MDRKSHRRRERSNSLEQREDMRSSASSSSTLMHTPNDTHGLVGYATSRRTPPVTYDEILRQSESSSRYDRGSSRRHRTEVVVPPATFEAIVIKCSCCNRAIDLRTIHCNSCCDANRQLCHDGHADRSRGAGGSGGRNGAYGRIAAAGRDLPRYERREGDVSASTSRSAGKSRDSKPNANSFRFLPAGAGRRIDCEERSNQRIGAESGLSVTSPAAPISLDEDLVDLSFITPQ